MAPFSEGFQSKWDSKYPSIGKLWKSNWETLTPFFEFPEEIRKIIYTTNAVESLNSTIRKIIRSRGSFPNEEAALKLIFLAIQNLIAKWEHLQGWKAAMNRFEIMAGERIKAALGAQL